MVFPFLRISQNWGFSTLANVLMDSCECILGCKLMEKHRLITLNAASETLVTSYVFRRFLQKPDPYLKKRWATIVRDVVSMLTLVFLDSWCQFQAILRLVWWANIFIKLHLFKCNKRNRKKWNICSKLTLKTPVVLVFNIFYTLL